MTSLVVLLVHTCEDRILYNVLETLAQPLT